MRRYLPLILGCALGLILATGVIQATGGSSEPEGPPFVLEESLATLEGAPAPLADLHAQASELLDGSVKKRLAELEGHPVVVNKWASWCGPCRAEFPVFQRAATQLGKEVAFLGINASDNREDAGAFLDKYPLPFPSYVDPQEKAARALGLSNSYPMTAFYDAKGKRTFVHQGQYESVGDLREDIERYAR